MTSPPALEGQAVCEVIVKSVYDAMVDVHVPGTDYRLLLTVAGAGGSLAHLVGERVHGVIRARALRIHTAVGGGQFIEPVAGEPRIIAGRLMAVDADGGTLLVKAAVPMVIAADENRDLSPFEPGQLVTFYVESGTTFTPLAE